MKFLDLNKREKNLIVFSLFRRLEVINQDKLPPHERNEFWRLESEEIRNLIEKLDGK